MTEQLKKIMAYPFWRQRIELGEGYVTTGRVNTTFWKALHFPEDLKGKSFLDIGSNDGLFSFMAEQKGASSIVASDLYKDSIGSMEDGWSDEGIAMLKEYLKSKISIHKKGIYHLDELNTQFDVVLVNHVINWLEDIELAVKTVSSATKGTLYISDGFLLESNSSDKIVPKDMPIKSLYKTSYIASLLEKQGFRIDKVTEINYQPFFIHDFVKYPTITVKKDTKVYQLPDRASAVKPGEDKQLVSYCWIGDFYQVFGLGWVHKDDVTVSFYKPSKAYALTKSLGLLKFYYAFLNSKFKKKNGYSYFIIKATKR